MRFARTGMALVFYIFALIVGAVLWLYYVTTWVDWAGALGLLIGLVTVPGIVIFPFIYWIVENNFPVGYFTLWAVMMVLFLLSQSAAT